jgi:hypothetical protein
MQPNSIIAAASLIAALMAAPPAFADGMVSKGATIAGSNVVVTKENGVTVYRAPGALLGGGEAPLAPTPEVAVSTTVKVVVVNHYHSKIRHLRTQGFYSGHPGKSRRFTQGFYSGPVDKGRSALDIRWRR